MIPVQFFSVVATFFHRLPHLFSVHLRVSLSLSLPLSPSSLSFPLLPPPLPTSAGHLSVSLLYGPVASLSIWGLFRVAQGRKEIHRSPPPPPPPINVRQSKTPKIFPVKALQLEPLVNDNLL